MLWSLAGAGILHGVWDIYKIRPYQVYSTILPLDDLLEMCMDGEVDWSSNTLYSDCLPSLIYVFLHYLNKADLL
jgi:hypothetical protein